LPSIVRCPDRLRDVEFFVVLHDVWHRRGGLTRNALHRATAISDALGKTVTVLTLAFTLDLDKSCESFSRMGLIGERVSIRNLFEDAGLNGGEPMGMFSEDAHRPDGSCVINGDDGPLDAWHAEETLDPDGRVVVTYRDEQGCTRRDERRDLSGRLRKVATFDSESGEPVRRLFFDTEGRPRVEFGRGPEKGARFQIRFADSSGRCTHVFPSERRLRTAWFQQTASCCEEAVFQVETESPLIAQAVLDMKDPHVARVAMLHSSHLDYPHTYGAPTMPEHEPILSRLGMFDAFVLITEEHKRDILEEFGPRDTIHAIPHDAPRSVDPSESGKDPWLGVGIGRFVERKNWDQVIRAFAQVVAVHPEARFELWGMGELQPDYESLIAELGIADSFRIMGSTDDAAAVFRRASYSVLAGIREGFGLVLVESMAQGTPAVAYDGKYGASDIIRHETDGLLVRYGDTEGLAAGMLAMVEDPDRAREMGRQAVQVGERFSLELCVERWLQVYCDAVEQKLHRVSLPAMTCRASHVHAARGRFRVNAQLDVGELGETPVIRLYIRPRDTIVGACYVEAREVAVRGSHLHFSADVDPRPVADSHVKWDVYASVSLRNAHRFVRIACDREAWGIWNAGGVAPAITQGGNLSFVQAPGRQSLRMLARRIRRRAKGIVVAEKADT